MSGTELSETSSPLWSLLYSDRPMESTSNKCSKSTFLMSIAGWEAKSLSSKMSICSNTKVKLWFNVDFKKFIWWQEDLRETLGKVHRQANNHHASDFKDSELILQDFINRYVDPSDTSPMKRFTSEVALWFNVQDILLSNYGKLNKLVQ